MKRYILFIFAYLLASVITAKAASHLSGNGQEAKRILIVNSFCEEVSWSKEIATTLEEQLNILYPNTQVNVEHLNADVAIVSGALNVSLRPILWSFAEKSEDHSITGGYSISTMLQTNIRPDIIVFIGNDGFLAYQNIEVELKDWKNIPLVLCAVNDSIIHGNWYPEETLQFDHIIPIEERRQREYIIPDGEPDMLDPDLLMNNRGTRKATAAYNITGVKFKVPVRQNLELIHHLIPDLEELVWVDDVFYSSEYDKMLLKKEAARLLPAVRITEIVHDRWNTDSIHQVMLQPGKRKAFITSSWDISGMHSKNSDETIATLFRTSSTVPMFSMTERPATNPYWLGGYYENRYELIEKTLKQIRRILNGEPVNSIPFEVVDNGWTRLDKALLNKYDLSGAASALTDVKYINIPPTLLQKYEKQLLVIFLLVTICICLVIYGFRMSTYNKRIKDESDRYKRLYDYLQNIYGNISMDFALFDKEGKCLFCIVDGQGYTTHIEQNGFFSENLFHSPFISEETKSRIKAGETINKEFTRHRHPGASSKEKDTYRIIAKTLSSTKFRSARYIVISLNLTPIVRNKKEKEHYERLFRFASDSSQVGVAYYNPEGTRKNATRSWYKNLNETDDAPMPPKYTHVVPEDREVLLGHQQKLRENPNIDPLHKEIRVAGKDGQTYWVEQHIFTYNKNNRHVIELNINIDKQKQNEEKLKKAKLQAEQAIVDTEKFIQSINHEIRTPLNSIIGFSEVLAYEQNEENGDEFITLIRQNNNLLTELIDNIIELSQIDSGRAAFQKDAMVIGEMIDEYTQYFRRSLYKKSLEVEFVISDKNAVIHTDKAYLHQVITNIISNAIKFTDSGGRIILGYEKRENEHYFYIQDSGRGISEEHQKVIFNRFEKVDNFVQGTGLGLPLCRRIVQQLGGELGVISEVGKGSTFWWTIPL